MIANYLKYALAIAAMLLLDSCASWLGPREVEVPLARLQASLDRKFPQDLHPMNLIDIHLGNPRLALQADTNRMSATMEAAVAPAFTTHIWRGSFTLSGMLQLDPVRRAILLAQPQIDKISLDGVDPAISDQVARAAGILATQILRDTPLYTFGPDDFRYGGSSFAPTRIVTKSSGLVVTFEPVKQGS